VATKNATLLEIKTINDQAKLAREKEKLVRMKWRFYEDTYYHDYKFGKARREIVEM
jgi:superoxide dismutase